MIFQAKHLRPFHISFNSAEGKCFRKARPGLTSPGHFWQICQPERSGL
ncbi:Uncharacterized protein dnm_066330 [Desulfonema magnum]|uniref:Uncharacterized protein n=1 Tax=Desulfonema magnum TaxID=45655 RepID=A0A975BSG1_9BACT|nr:Uncharacterized protein dnm_066330 [Desulfonema magnum]